MALSNNANIFGFFFGISLYNWWQWVVQSAYSNCRVYVILRIWIIQNSLSACKYYTVLHLEKHVVVVIIFPFPVKLYLLPTAECRFPWAPNHIDPPIQLPSNPRCCNLVSKFPGTEIKISQLAYFDEKLRPIRLSCNDLLERNDRKERDIKIYDIIFRQTWSFLTTASVILCDKCIICICWSPPFWKSDEKKIRYTHGSYHSLSKLEVG